MLWDVVISAEKRRTGVMEANHFQWKMCRMFAKNLRPAVDVSFQNLLPAEDVDVRQNRMAIVDNLNLGIYDVSHAAGDREKIFNNLVMIGHTPTQRVHVGSLMGFPRVRWSPEGSLMSTSGMFNTRNELKIWDVCTMESIDTISYEKFGSKGVFTHEHSQHEPALVAVGSTASHVLITDLRTGNVTQSSSAHHTNSIISVQWSISDDYFMASASNREIFIWDRRNLNKSAYTQMYYDFIFDFPPYMQFVDRYKILVMNSSRRIFLNEVRTGHLIHTYDQMMLVRRGDVMRPFKFALNRTSQVLYYPVRGNWQAVDLRKNEVVEFSLKFHIFPIEMMIFNEFLQDLYTINHQNECIVWSPFR